MSGRLPVTYSRKRYIAVCAGCDLLFEAERRDQLTCSPACRVRAHRSGELKRRTAIAASLRIPVAMMGHAQALTRLRPDLEPRIMSGDATYDEMQPEVCEAFWQAAWEAARAAAVPMPELPLPAGTGAGVLNFRCEPEAAR